MNSQKKSFWFTPKGLGALGLIAAATYFLLIEHQEHVWQYLPFMILLACPLIHIFMHGGHGQHAEEEKEEQSKDDYQRGLEDGRKQNNHHSHH
tara:strand:+ start:2291 stop:2569 length:279 start_codon:yes stop_codon:yes gene_type:complete